MRHRRALIALAFAATAGAQTQELALKAGESGDLFGVYWITNCKSILKGFLGVDVLSGPPGLEATLRQEPVLARRQNCPDKVPGATVVLSAKEVPAAFNGTVMLRVRYDTEDGTKQSTHNVKLMLFPAR